MKNLFLKHNKKIACTFILFILFSIYVYILSFSYSLAVSSDISDSVFRLHVIANSDSKEDQELKYKVRDSLIQYMGTLTNASTTKEEAINIAIAHQEDFKEIALATIHNEGYSYDVNINIGNFEFPTKQYGDISLPAGYYDALRVEIGDAKGQNWWCVMFPPLCFVDVSSGIVPDESKEVMKEELTDEEFNLISENNSDNLEIKFKFKLLEFFKNKPSFANLQN